MLHSLSKEELISITGGESLWGKWTKTVEDAGQFVGGFIHGLVYGDCPPKC